MKRARPIFQLSGVYCRYPVDKAFSRLTILVYLGFLACIGFVAYWTLSLSYLPLLPIKLPQYLLGMRYEVSLAAHGGGQDEYLESQVAQNNGPLYHKIAQSSLKVAHNYWPTAFQAIIHAPILGPWRSSARCVALPPQGAVAARTIAARAPG